MKVPGTKLDIPVPDGWSVTYDAKERKVIVYGKGKETNWYKDRHVTVEIPLNGNLQLYHWDGNKLCRARWKETRMRVPQTWISGKGWVPSGAPPRRSTSNAGRRIDLTLFDLANGDI